MKLLVYLALATGLLFSAQPASAQWKPPVGIPAPSFGITNVAKARPAVWSAPVNGFYYVDATVSASTDTANANGTPARPRKTIPLVLPAGAVVELHGSYSDPHTSPRGLVSRGTATAPVFIRGQSATARPIVYSCWEMTGTYYIVENIEFAGCGSVVFLAPTDKAALRHSDVHGSIYGGGVGVLSWNGLTATGVVLWNNQVHDNGDLTAGYDQDVHGIALSERVNNIWIVDNQIARNSGDGLQINAGSAALQSTTHHIYVGRNSSHHNKQSGFWTKQAVDVIFSQNQSYGHRPGNSSPGACMGGQYAPEHVWFIDNVVWDCDFGIQLASDAGQGTGISQFFVGNIITRIHDTNGDFQPGSAWQNCGISLPGGTNRYVLQNSMYDVDSGVCVPYAGGSVFNYDNVMEGVRSNGSHVNFDSPGTAANAKAGGNLFAPNYRLTISGATTTTAAGQLNAPTSNSVVPPSIKFVNPAAGDFHLSATSPAIGYGMMKQLGVWEYFASRYGVPLSVDAYGVSRAAPAAVVSGAVQR